jgi:hypothetical protein
VQSNPKLSTVLAAYSDAQQPPPETPTWTLDALFLLPKTRLKYYRKLYGRLLKSTAPGRSDHKLLLRAIDTLDRLLSTAEGRADVQVGGPPLAPPAIETEDEVVINMNGGDDAKKPSPTVSSENPTTPGSASSSARGSLLSSGYAHLFSSAHINSFQPGSASPERLRPPPSAERPRRRYPCLSLTLSDA